REVTIGAYAHQDLPFEILVEKLQTERDLSRSPLFQVMFALQNVPIETVELSAPTLSLVEVETGRALFDLTLFMVETEQGLVGALEYNTDLFDTITIRRMVGHFQTLLAGVVADPNRRLARLPLLTVDEQMQLLVEWNTTGDRGQGIGNRIEASGIGTGDAC